MTKQSVGEFLATLRRAHGYTQQEVADRLGISNRTLSAWERDTSAPDVLLLPVLADLYGVTVDEILRGERRAGSPPALSDTSEKLLYKSRLHTFTVQMCVLVALFCVFLMLVFLGVLYLAQVWAIVLLCIGLAGALIDGGIFFVLLKVAESSADESGAGYAAFRLTLRVRVSAGLFFLAGLLAVFSIVAFAMWVATGLASELHTPSGVLAGVYLALAGLFAAIALVERYFAFRKWGKTAKKRFRPIALLGALPALLAVVLMLVFSFCQPTAEDVLCTKDMSEFRGYLESIDIPEGGLAPAGTWELELSYHGAGFEDVTDLGNGFFGVYNPLRGEVNVYWGKKSEKEINYDVYLGLAKRLYMRNGRDTVYNLRYARETDIRFALAHVEDIYAYVGMVAGEEALVRVTRYDLSEIFYYVGAMLIGLDAVVFAAVYCLRRQKYEEDSE